MPALLPAAAVVTTTPIVWSSGDPVLWSSGDPVLWGYGLGDLIELSAPVSGSTYRGLNSPGVARGLDGDTPLRTLKAGAPTVEP